MTSHLIDFGHEEVGAWIAVWAIKACVVVLAQFAEALWSEEGKPIGVVLLELLYEALSNMPPAPALPMAGACLQDLSSQAPKPADLPVSPLQNSSLSAVQGAHSVFAELLHHITSASYGHPVPVQFLFLLLDMR